MTDQIHWRLDSQLGLSGRRFGPAEIAPALPHRQAGQAHERPAESQQPEHWQSVGDGQVEGERVTHDQEGRDRRRWADPGDCLVRHGTRPEARGILGDGNVVQEKSLSLPKRVR